MNESLLRGAVAISGRAKKERDVGKATIIAFICVLSIYLMVSVLSMGVFLTATTKIVDRKTGEVHRGYVPPYSVVVPGSLPDPHGGPSLSCAVIVKTVDAQTRSKTSINDLLRD